MHVFVRIIHTRSFIPKKKNYNFRLAKKKKLLIKYFVGLHIV